MEKIINYKNENCSISFNIETKSINGIGYYNNFYIKTNNETTRGIIKASKELKNIFNSNTNIHDVVNFLCTNQKIMMTFKFV